MAPARRGTPTPRRTTGAIWAPARTAWCCRCGSGESFVADANRFAQAALYATDSGVDVIQEALGTLNGPLFARQAIEYAYHHGVTVIASAADEAAEHHNLPGSMPDTIVVNSVNKYSSLTSTPPSYLQLNGCTNFGTRIVLSVPSSSCSSEATGKSAGVAGLIYSAAEDALHAGRLRRSGDCHRVDGSRCVITANEVRQLMASGDIGSTAPGDQGSGQADDVNFAAQPESSCATHRVATCTDPNRQISFALDQLGGVVGPLPHTTRYPARKGFDEFYGYGRLNAYKAVSAAYAGTIRARGRDHRARLVHPGRPGPRIVRGAGQRVRARLVSLLGVGRAGRQPEQQRRLPPGVVELVQRVGRALAVLLRRAWQRRRRSAEGAVPAGQLHRQRRRRRTPTGARTPSPTHSP